MSRRFARRRNGAGEGDALADTLHRGAIGLLRRIKVADQESGISPPRLSALSVLVFGGAQSLASLAKAEGVKAPTMSALVAALEKEGLVEKTADREDRRSLVIAATAKGRKVMLQGRDRRLALLEQRLATLTREERRLLAQAAPLILRLSGRG
jgi:DNA-binding MarR family transcriptional regulator